MQVVREFDIDLRDYFHKDIANFIAKKISTKITNKVDKKLKRTLGRVVRDVLDEPIHSFIDSVPGQLIRQLLQQLLAPTAEYMLFAKLSVKEVRYASVDSKGQAGAVLSGLVIIPTGNVGSPNMPVMGYQHGSTIARKNAPSYFDPENPFLSSMEVIIAMLLASLNGYIITMADYQGLGHDEANVQPYMGARPLAHAVLDLLLDTLQYVDRSRNIWWNQQIFLLGYSQGGYVTLAAAREIQENKTYQHFLPYLKAVAPCAGPYALSSVMRYMILREELYPFGAFLIMTIRGYDAMFGQDLQGIFTKEKAIKPAYWHIWDLADGSISMFEINALLPKIPRDMLTDALIQQLSTEGSDVYQVLKENDVLDWKPSMPIQFYQSPRDGLVPFENMMEADRAFKQQGVQVGMVPMFFIPMGSSVPMPMANRTHVEAAIPCLLGGYAWFSPFRFQQVNGVLETGNFMLYGQSLKSENGEYCLNYQLDGNLALYRKTDGVLLWQAGIVASRAKPLTSVCLVPNAAQQALTAYPIHAVDNPVPNPGICIIQEEDGDFVVYDNQGHPLWESGTYAIPDRLIVGNDGIMVIQDCDGETIWQVPRNAG